jgi:hypothetical protein
MSTIYPLDEKVLAESTCSISTGTRTPIYPLCYNSNMLFKSVFQNDKDNESALYYLSMTLNGDELNYSLIEKICLALMFVIKKLKHYLD